MSDVWDIIDGIDDSLKERKEQVCNHRFKHSPLNNIKPSKEKRLREQEQAKHAKLRARLEEEERQLMSIQQAEKDRRDQLKAVERARWKQQRKSEGLYEALLDMKAESSWMAQFEAQMAKNAPTPLRSQRSKMYAFYRDEWPPSAEQLAQMQERAAYLSSFSKSSS